MRFRYCRLVTVLEYFMPAYCVPFTESVPAEDIALLAPGTVMPVESVEVQDYALPKAVLLDRDHSILAFNERVFDWAVRPDVPLLERLRYLCIVSSNLDEFFEVRAAPHVAAARSGDTKGACTAASFELLAAKAQALVARQYALYNDELVPAFARRSAAGCRVISSAKCALCWCLWGWIRRTRFRRWPTSR